MGKALIIMGVSGSGKTTIGKLLSEDLDIPFLDADDYHPKSNVDKMSLGIPLTDEDRQPWLQELRQIIQSYQQKKGLILACSALKTSYRQLLSINDQVDFVWLKVDRETLQKRLNQRKNHFMPESLIDSQLSTLEEPNNTLVIDGKLPPNEILKIIKTQF